MQESCKFKALHNWSFISAGPLHSHANTIQRIRLWWIFSHPLCWRRGPSTMIPIQACNKGVWVKRDTRDQTCWLHGKSAMYIHRSSSPCMLCRQDVTLLPLLNLVPTEYCKYFFTAWHSFACQSHVFSFCTLVSVLHSTPSTSITAVHCASTVNTMKGIFLGKHWSAYKTVTLHYSPRFLHWMGWGICIQTCKF